MPNCSCGCFRRRLSADWDQFTDAHTYKDKRNERRQRKTRERERRRRTKNRPFSFKWKKRKYFIWIWGLSRMRTSEIARTRGKRREVVNGKIEPAERSRRFVVAPKNLWKNCVSNFFPPFLFFLSLPFRRFAHLIPVRHSDRLFSLLAHFQHIVGHTCSPASLWLHCRRGRCRCCCNSRLFLNLPAGLIRSIEDRFVNHRILAPKQTNTDEIRAFFPLSFPFISLRSASHMQPRRFAHIPRSRYGLRVWRWREIT